MHLVEYGEIIIVVIICFFVALSFFSAALSSSRFLPPPPTRCVMTPRGGAKVRPAKNLNYPSDYHLKLRPPVSFRLSFIHLVVISKFICITYLQPRAGCLSIHIC